VTAGANEALGYQGNALGYQNEALARNQPWLAAGEGGLTKLSDLVKSGFEAPTQFKYGSEEFQTDPGYEFRLGEGMKGIENSAAARGGALSGAAIKEAARYNQGFASNEFQNAYTRASDTFGSNFDRALQKYGTNVGAASTLAGYGQNARSEMTGIDTTKANIEGARSDIATNRGLTLADLETQAGNARASGYTGAANAWNNMIGGIAGSAAQLLPGGTLSEILKRKKQATFTSGVLPTSLNG
jgi:hypothetical protein